MFPPDYEFLSILGKAHGSGGWLISGSKMHRNPRFFKYRWQIFWRDSPRKGANFLAMEPLATKEALELMDWLSHRNEPYMYSNTRSRRRGIAIWNLNSPNYANEIWASAYDDDPDPIHSSGHR
jgi:hypothetical protein